MSDLAREHATPGGLGSIILYEPAQVLVCLVDLHATPWLIVFSLYTAGIAGGLQGVTAWMCGRLGYLCESKGDWSVVIVFEICHHLSLAAPLLGWALARRALRKASPPSRDGQWILSGGAPLWALGLCGLYTMMTIFGLLLASGLSYAAPIGILLLLAARLAFNIWWFSRCLADSSRVALLRWKGAEGAEPPFSLQGFEDTQLVTVSEVDELTGKVGVMRGTIETVWKAIGPVADLAQILRAGSAGKAGAPPR